MQTPDSSCGRTPSEFGQPDVVVTAELRSRLHAYTEKAIREAGVHTSWNEPNEKFEAAVHTWIDDVIDGPVGAEMTGLVTQLDAHAISDSHVQKLLSMDGPRHSRHLSRYRTVGRQPG